MQSIGTYPGVIEGKSATIPALFAAALNTLVDKGWRATRPVVTGLFALLDGANPGGPDPFRAPQRWRKVRLSRMTGPSPTSTSVSAGSAASPRRSSRASW